MGINLGRKNLSPANGEALARLPALLRCWSKKYGNVDTHICISLRDMCLRHHDSSLLNARAPERAARAPSRSPASRFRCVRARNPGTSRNPERPPPPVRLPRERSFGGIVVVLSTSRHLVSDEGAPRASTRPIRGARDPRTPRLRLA